MAPQSIDTRSRRHTPDNTTDRLQQMGQVIGQSARGADVPGTDPISTPEMMATVMHTLFDAGQLRLRQGLPRNLTDVIENSHPIQELF